MPSKAWLACSTVATCCTTGWVVANASWPIAPRLVKAASTLSASHSGCSFRVVRPSIQVAKPSLSHRSSHHAMVTRLPNHWWAISCAAVVNTRCWSDTLDVAGSSRSEDSKVKIAPQFSIALKNWLRPGAAMLSSFGSG